MLSPNSTALSRVAHSIDASLLTDTASDDVQQWLAAANREQRVATAEWRMQRALFAMQLVRPPQRKPTRAQLDFVDTTFEKFFKKYHIGGKEYAEFRTSVLGPESADVEGVEAAVDDADGDEGAAGDD